MVRSDHSRMLLNLARWGDADRAWSPLHSSSDRAMTPADVEDHMKRIIWGTAFTVAVMTIAAFRGIGADDPAAAAAARVERGHYLVESIGCQDCHTPKKMGQN